MIHVTMTIGGTMAMNKSADAGWHIIQGEEESHRRRNPWMPGARTQGSGGDLSTSPSLSDSSETSSPKTNIVMSNAGKAILPKIKAQPSKMNMTPKRDETLMTQY